MYIITSTPDGWACDIMAGSEKRKYVELEDLNNRNYQEVKQRKMGKKQKNENSTV